MDNNTETAGRPDLRAMEAKFRQGARHSAGFLTDEARRMVEENATAKEIVGHLRDLAEVLQDWRERRIPMPEGNPWMWSESKLDAFIARRREEW